MDNIKFLYKFGERLITALPCLPLCNRTFESRSKSHGPATHATRNLEFVHVSSAGFGVVDKDAASNADRRRIRSLVMKDFRRKQRQGRTSKFVTDGTSAGLESDEQVTATEGSTPSSIESTSLHLPPTVSARLVWRQSFGSRMAEA